jgi:hypothetical protein
LNQYTARGRSRQNQWNLELTASAIVFPHDKSAAPRIAGFRAYVSENSLNPFAAVVAADFALPFVGDGQL